MAAGVASAVVLGGGTAGGDPTPTGAVPTDAGPSTAVPTTAPPTTPPGAVTVAAGVDDPGTDDARRVLDAYVTAINDERYADAFALFSADSATAGDGLPAWLDAQQPRTISDARLVSVRPAGAGDLTAVLTFRSRQDPTFSPDGLSACLDWELSYDLAAPDRLIRSSALVTDPRPC